MRKSSKPAPANDGKVMYRYEDHGGVVTLLKLPVIRYTPCGTWVNYWGTERFVLSNTLKKFACKDEPEAKTSFFARKAKQLKILKAQLENVEHAVRALKEGRLDDRQLPDWLNCYHRFRASLLEPR